HMNVSATHASTNVTHIRNAQPSCGPRDGIKHGLKIELGSANRAEHLADRSLIFQRFLQLARPRLHLFEQPGVLDGNYGLVGEGLEQFDLSIGERANLGASDRNRADGLTRMN